VSTDFLFPIGIVLLGTVFPVALLILAIKRLRQPSQLSRKSTIWWSSVGFVSLLPLLGISLLLVWFAIDNFPFTSGVIAHASSPAGEEACVVQTFKGAEPYQVSLYARRTGQSWMWHYLAHQDDRWRSCHLEFVGDQLRVYTGSTLRKSFSVPDATTRPDAAHEELPASYTPEQISAQHNAHYRD
jgi:hypothetical protein